jgi:hypothetical protein
MREAFPGILISILRSNPGPESIQGKMYVIIQQGYGYLEETLRRSFAGQDNVEVIVDRRSAERRTTRQPVAFERRRADRRKSREHLVEVVIAGESPGSAPAGGSI